MTQRQVAPYGSWKSPITAELIAAGAVRLGQIKVDAGSVYWLEGRPTQAGRNVLVRLAAGGSAADVTPPDFNVRTRAHEYGGGAFTVADDLVYFCNDRDQRIYRQRGGTEPESITPEAQARYADLLVDRWRNRLICVREDHATEDEPQGALVAVSLTAPGSVQVLSQGKDFYSSPRLSPDGSKLAWLAWQHPNMPWDDSELWLANVAADGSLTDAKCVAGRAHESIFQPEWSPGGTLHFVSDRSGWWNIHRLCAGGVEAVCVRAAEFGVPQWVFGLSTYVFSAPDEIVCTYAERGIWRLGRIDCKTGTLSEISTPYCDIGYLCAEEGRVIFGAAASDASDGVIQLNTRSWSTEVLHRSSTMNIDPRYFSAPREIEFPTHNGDTAYAFWYAPCNPDYAPAPGELPPLVVVSHGGPTSASTCALKLNIQFWTSRGFAVLDVNYGGSSGFGRAYRERLDGAWGVTDVLDCVNGARHLIQQHLVDGARCVIRGNSAGGYTTLCALTFHEAFKAGASYYGVSDLTLLARDTHKFESRYLDRLVGPYPAQAQRYRERSPLHAVDRINAPVIFLQGLEDKVVPPNQAEQMVAALRAKGLPVAYVAFEGEQHGFRRAQNIQRSLEAELYFYSQVFGFELAEAIEPVPIDNLNASS